MQRQDVRVLQVGGRLDLGQEALGPHHGSQLGFQDLERDLALMAEVLGQVDSGHPALADFALDAVSALKGSVQAGDGVGHPGKILCVTGLRPDAPGGRRDPRANCAKNCADAHRRWPALTNASMQRFQRLRTPTDARKGLAKQALSQLSYGPVRPCYIVLSVLSVIGPLLQLCATSPRNPRLFEQRLVSGVVAEEVRMVRP